MPIVYIGMIEIYKIMSFTHEYRMYRYRLFNEYISVSATQNISANMNPPMHAIAGSAGLVMDRFARIGPDKYATIHTVRTD